MAANDLGLGHPSWCHRAGTTHRGSSSSCVRERVTQGRESRFSIRSLRVTEAEGWSCLPTCTGADALPSTYGVGGLLLNGRRVLVAACGDGGASGADRVTVTFMASGSDCEHEWGAQELALTESEAIDVCLLCVTLAIATDV